LFLYLFLTALFSYHISCAKAKQDGNTAAEGSILVASFTVSGQARETPQATVTIAIEARGGFRGTALEQAAVICEGRQAEAEDDYDCQC
jgi:hypothetical protein